MAGMNLRLTITAAVAVFLASLSLMAVIASNGWMFLAIGAITVVALAGIVTRMSSLPSATTTTFLVLIGVVPLLSGPNWAVRITGLVIVALTAASATGTRLLRSFAILAGYLACLLIFLNLVFASAASIGRVIPSYHSAAVLVRLCRAAFSQFGYAPPVQDSRPVSLIAAGGIGLVAVIVDILAVRLRRPAVAGLPLLLLFSVPVASDLKTLGFSENLAFAAGLAGYLALLSADGRQRLRMWGRLVTFRYVQSADETGSGPDTRELAASGRRIGLAAVCLAVAIPIVLPSMHVHHVFGTTSDGSAPGAGISPDALLKVQDQLTGKASPVLTYTSTAHDASLQYLKVFTLNYFGGKANVWVPQLGKGDRTATGPDLPFAVPGQIHGAGITSVTTKVTMDKPQPGPLFLPVPYAPVQLTSFGTIWTETPGTLMLFNAAAPIVKFSYNVTSDEPTPTPTGINEAASTQFMPQAIQTEYGTYTGPDASQLTKIAKAHTPQGSPTELQVADALQDWFTSGAFTYTLKPHLPASNWLPKFLTTDKRGFCSQFAWAFAILARLLNIPARIATGYTGGTRIGGTDTYQVTSADAHAWPELYFPGEGWLRFEPTPSGDHGQGTATVPAYARGRPGRGGGSQSPVPNQGSSGAAGSTQGAKSSAANRLKHFITISGNQTHNASSADLWLAVGVPVLLFLLIAWPALTRLVTRRRRWLTASGHAGHAHAAWRELTDDLADYGLACVPGETPRAVTRRVAREASLSEAAAAAASRIGTAEERARYARQALPDDGLAADVRAVRRAVAASVTPKQRLLARLLPASTLTAARRLLERAGGLLGWLDSSWPALQRQVRRAVLGRAS
jgi:hypothetical protein